MVLARLEGRFAADAAIGAADEGDRHGSAHYPRYRVWGRNCIGMMVLVAAASAVLAPAASAAARFVPGEALVRYEAGATPVERAAARDGADVTLEDVLGLPRTQLVSFDGSVGSAVTRLERSPVVLDAQPNYRYRANAPVPDDTFFGQQWGLGVAPGVDVLPAWDRTRGGGQVIAVVDTGVDLTHPDLTGSLWVNPGETAANGLDDDGNGKVDDVHGYDFVDADADPDDFQFHGTHVAGIATAAAANAEGTAGVAPEADLMAVRALDGNGFGDTADIAEAVRYSAQEGAGVINLSLGGPAGGPSDAVFLQAVQVAEAADAVVVVAAGNAGSNNDAEPTVPCNFPSPNLICVAALDSSGALAGYSNYGLTTVNVGAPGSAILSSKTDWAAPLFTENFDAGLTAWTSFPETSPWAEVTPGAGGTGKAATDSPGGPYPANREASLTRSSPLLLDGRGCRMHFDLKSDVHESDGLVAGAVTDDVDVDDGLLIEENFAAFDTAEVSLSLLDGRADVYPTFLLFSGASFQGDGATVDNVRVLCRDETYLNSIVSANNYAAANGGSYMRISGTSMATPHVVRRGRARPRGGPERGRRPGDQRDRAGRPLVRRPARAHEHREAGGRSRGHQRSRCHRHPAGHVHPAPCHGWVATARADAHAARSRRCRRPLPRGPARPHHDPHRGRSRCARHLQAARRLAPKAGPQDLVQDVFPRRRGDARAPEPRWAPAAEAPRGSGAGRREGRAHERGRPAERYDPESGRARDAPLRHRQRQPSHSCVKVGNLGSLATRDYIEAVHNRVVVFDGGMGATLEQFELTQEDYGGLQGKCHEALVLNRPDVIQGVHESMLDAGAEVVETDTFQASRLKLEEWGLGEHTPEINRRAAEIARAAAGESRFVAGSIGPTGTFPRATIRRSARSPSASWSRSSPSRRRA